jgi:hypothetical protein
VRSLSVLTCVLLFFACAHTPPPLPGLEVLKPAVETFHQRIRWKDFRGAAELIVPERRTAFERAVRERRDERDLQINDYELEDAKLSEDGLSAEVASRITWMRLPSSSVKEELVISHFVLRGSSWLLQRQENGPFGSELSAEYAPEQ